jgi:hypothetical protein
VLDCAIVCLFIYIYIYCWTQRGVVNWKLEISTLSRCKCSDCCDSMWFVFVHQNAQQKLIFPWKGSSVFHGYLASTFKNRRYNMPEIQNCVSNRLKNKTDQLVDRRKSHLTIANKLHLYRGVIKPIWNYGIKLWGCASESNVVIMHRSQSKIRRAIPNAPRYVTNHTLHTDINIPYVIDVIHERINKNHNNLEVHPNPLLQPLLQPTITSGLNRCWPIDLHGNWSDIAGWIPYHVIVILYLSVLCTVSSESRCAVRLRYVDLVVSIEVAVAVCCCFTAFSC